MSPLSNDVVDWILKNDLISALGVKLNPNSDRRNESHFLLFKKRDRRVYGNYRVEEFRPV